MALSSRDTSLPTSVICTRCMRQVQQGLVRLPCSIALAAYVVKLVSVHHEGIVCA